ncbi:MAG: hypothetical protein U0836_09195 [Pirellulales bacterium]
MATKAKAGVDLATDDLIAAFDAAAHADRRQRIARDAEAEAEALRQAAKNAEIDALLAKLENHVDDRWAQRLADAGFRRGELDVCENRGRRATTIAGGFIAGNDPRLSAYKAALAEYRHEFELIAAVLGGEIKRRWPAVKDADKPSPTTLVALLYEDRRIEFPDGLVETLSDNEHTVLTALAEKKAADLECLRDSTGHATPNKVLAALLARLPRLAAHVQLPGGKGRGGYKTNVVLAQAPASR